MNNIGQKFPVDIADKNLFKRINNVSEENVLNNPQAIFPFLLDLDNNTRAIVLSPFSILSINKEEKKIRIDRKEWNTEGFQPRLHLPIFHLAELPIEKVPDKIQESALCAGSVILNLLLEESACNGYTGYASNIFGPHFLRFEQRIYAESIDDNPHTFKETETKCAWMRQWEFNEANRLEFDGLGKKSSGPIVFKRSNEITLGKAIKSCFRYGVNKNKSIKALVFGKPTLKQIREVVAFSERYTVSEGESDKKSVERYSNTSFGKLLNQALGLNKKEETIRLQIGEKYLKMFPEIKIPFSKTKFYLNMKEFEVMISQCPELKPLLKNIRRI